MRNHLLSVALGVLMALLGAVLRFGTPDLDMTVVSAPALGLVFLVLGVIEVLVSGVALVRPSSRHQDRPL